LPEEGGAPELVTFQLDGRPVQSRVGTILVDAAAEHGVEIPIFCYEPRLGPPIGACRMCLVEIEGMRGLQTACSTPVSADMVVSTGTPVVKDAQDGVLELLLANHPLDCPVCDKGGECPLQDRTFSFGPGASRFIEPKRHFPKPLDLSGLIALDRERCIACFRCVRFSQEVAEDGQLTFQERGGSSEISTFTGDPYVGRFTGNIIDICPVGALTSIPYRFVARPWDNQVAPSVCSYCPVGCNTELTMREGRLMRVTARPTPNAAVEEGWLCDKGRWGYAASWSADRLREAGLRDSVGRRDVPLQRAVEQAALMLRRAPSPAILLGPAATVEEGFVAQAVAATALSGAPVARLGRAGGGLGPLRALPGAQLVDLDSVDLVAIVGGDPANQQPVVELRVRKAVRLGARLVSVGPRPHALERLGQAVRSEPGRLGGALGPLEEALATADRAVVLWDEADLVAEPDAAALVAGLVAGRPGARQLELGSEVNGAGLRALGIPTAEGLLQRIEAGEIGTLVAVGADPHAAAGAARWAAALERVTQVMVIATHASPLSERAQVVLPALAAEEQEGVLVAMNGRAQRLRAAQRGPRGAAPAWEILVALTHRMGRPLPYRSAREAFAAAAAAHPALGGMSYTTLGVGGQVLPRAEAADQAADGAGGAAGEGLVLVGTTPIFGDATSHRSDALASVRSGAEAAVGPGQARALGVGDGARVRLESPYGACELPLRVDDALADGAVYVTLGVPGAGVERLLPPDGGPVRVALAPVPAEVAA
jgi:NADH-quinone oxidoreductase subunit G